MNCFFARTFSLSGEKATFRARVHCTTALSLEERQIGPRHGARAGAVGANVARYVVKEAGAWEVRSIRKHVLWADHDE